MTDHVHDEKCTQDRFEDEDDKIVPMTPEVEEGELVDAMERILLAFGWDMMNESVENTPKRFLKYLREFHQRWSIEEVLGTPFDSPDNSMVIQDGIPFRMICEHHLLPAIGRAAIGYIPNGKVLGLSKFTRLVQAVGTEKPSLQEHITDRLLTILNDYLKPHGVIVVIEAEHGCMACRGVNVPSVITRTSKVSGLFLKNGDARAEFFQVAQRGVNRRG